MFRIIKDDNILSSFSPGFFFYKNDIFFIDKKLQSIFLVSDNKIPLKNFLHMLDEDSSTLFLKILKSTATGDVAIINTSVTNENIHKKVLIQGSVIERDLNGNATSFSGYCVEVKNEFSVPRIYNTAEIGIWEWDGVSGKCNFCKDYHKMLGYNWPYERLPDNFERWTKLVHPDDMEAVLFQEKLSRTQDIGDKFECFVRLRHKNGEYIWTIGKGFVAQRDHLGRAISIRGTNQSIDIVQKNYEHALERTLRDSLTGCYNRDFLKKYWERMKQGGTWPISFLYIDICGLKMINDMLGHDIGDNIIIELVHIIESVIQMTKYIIRMGGDEFLVILPECNIDLISECEKNIYKYMKFINQKNNIPIIFSIGMSTMNNKHESIIKTINIAERNMQKNKNASHREDMLFLQSYIETLKNKKVIYQDSRLGQE